MISTKHRNKVGHEAYKRDEVAFLLSGKRTSLHQSASKGCRRAKIFDMPSLLEKHSDWLSSNRKAFLPKRDSLHVRLQVPMVAILEAYRVRFLRCAATVPHFGYCMALFHLLCPALFSIRRTLVTSCNTKPYGV